MLLQVENLAQIASVTWPRTAPPVPARLQFAWEKNKKILIKNKYVD